MSRLLYPISLSLNTSSSRSARALPLLLGLPPPLDTLPPLAPLAACTALNPAGVRLRCVHLGEPQNSEKIVR